jgi:hypothetical protein
MTPIRIVAIALIVAGIVGLIYGNFSYTKEKHEAKIGQLELSVNEKENVSIPTWLSAGGIAAGVLLLLVRRKP